jgi:hypothetical protein
MGIAHVRRSRSSRRLRQRGDERGGVAAPGWICEDSAIIITIAAMLAIAACPSFELQKVPVAGCGRSLWASQVVSVVLPGILQPPCQTAGMAEMRHFREAW